MKSSFFQKTKLSGKVKKIAVVSHLDLNIYLFRLELMKFLLNKGWKVYALFPEGEYSEKIKQYGIECIHYKLDRRSLNPFKELKTLLDIKTKLIQIKPHILHTVTVKPNIYGTIAGKMAGVPIIVNSVTGVGSFFVDDSFKAKCVKEIILKLYSFTMRYSNGVIFLNQDDMNLFLNKKILKRDKAFLIKGSGIDTNLWKPVEKKQKNSYPVKIVCIARLIKHKGVEEYLRVAEVLKKEFKERVEFILIGDFYDGNHYPISEELLSRYIKNKIIIYYRWMPLEDVKEMLRQCDIFVLLSYREGVPRTGIEALSVGLPIIITNVPGCKEIVEDGKNGFLVPVKNVDKVVEKLKLLIENPNVRQKFGEYSRQKGVREFDVRLIVQKYLDVYLKLMENL